MPSDNSATEARQKRGLAIAALCRITPKEDGTWLVPSQNGSGHYRVCLNPASPAVPMCTCPDYETRSQPCKHVFAVQYVVQRETNPDGSVTLTEVLTITEQTTTVPDRPTYRQDWPAYNAAQMGEKARFQELLFDLCQGIPPAPPPKRGRPRCLYSDVAFAITYKVYSTLSTRRFQTDLDDAEAKGFLTKAPHYNSVINYLEDPALTPILHGLIIESSLPLKEVESDFAVDSTGFMTSRFSRWYDHKYGKFVKEHDWVKVHVMTGDKTNVVTAVEIRGKDAADSPLLPALVNTTARSFNVAEVSADKGYSSADNVDAVAAVGAIPYIAFRKNATGSVGGLFEKMYHTYCLNREDFLKHYHKRSNVESTVAMIKTKFGDHIRSKTDVAMANEALAKILCHNLCCLISAAYELGIEATFWEKAAEPEAPVVEPEAATVNGEMEIEAWAWV